MAISVVGSAFQKSIKFIGYETPKGCAIASWLPRGARLTNASSASLAGRVATRSLFTAADSVSAKVDMQRYEELACASNEIVGDRLIDKGVRVILQKFGDNPGTPESTTEELWDRVAYHAIKHGAKIGPFNPNDPHTNILTLSSVFSRERVTSTGLEKGDNPEDYISTPTELYWMLSSPSTPFTRDSRKELMSAEHMASLAKEAKIPIGLSSLSTIFKSFSFYSPLSWECNSPSKPIIFRSWRCKSSKDSH